jgi:hypothetical protein
MSHLRSVLRGWYFATQLAMLQLAHLADMDIANEKTLQFQMSYATLEDKLDLTVSAKLAAVELERLRNIELGRADALAFREKFANFVRQRAAADRAKVGMHAAFWAWKSVSSLASFEQTVARELAALHSKADALQSELNSSRHERNRLEAELAHVRSSSAASQHAAGQEEARLRGEAAMLAQKELESRLQLERAIDAQTKLELELEQTRNRLEAELAHVRSSSAASQHAAGQEEARLRGEAAMLAQKELESRLQLERAIEAQTKLELELERTQASGQAAERELAGAFKGKLLAERTLSELRQHLSNANVKVATLEGEIRKAAEAHQHEQSSQRSKLHLLECERSAELERFRTELAASQSDLATQRRKVEDLLATANVAEETNRRNEWQLVTQDRIFGEQKIYFRSLISELKAHQELMHQEVLRLQADLTTTLCQCESFVESSIVKQYESASKSVSVSTHLLDRLFAAASFEPLLESH